MNTEIEVFLAHYGVEGMKWGVRRYDRIKRFGGSRVGISKKRSKAFIESDLERLASGKNISVGFTKKKDKQHIIAET